MIAFCRLGTGGGSRAGQLRVPPESLSRRNPSHPIEETVGCAGAAQVPVARLAGLQLEEEGERRRGRRGKLGRYCLG